MSSTRQGASSVTPLRYQTDEETQYGERDDSLSVDAIINDERDIRKSLPLIGRFMGPVGTAAESQHLRRLSNGGGPMQRGEEEPWAEWNHENKGRRRGGGSQQSDPDCGHRGKGSERSDKATPCDGVGDDGTGEAVMMTRRQELWMWAMGKHGFREWLSALWSEFLGTYLLILIGCGAICVGESKETVAAMFALCLIFLIESLLPFSDAHFNPVVTIVMVLNHKTPFLLAICYTFTQCVASTVAAFTIKLLVPKAGDYQYGITKVNEEIYDDAWRPLLLEVVMTFVLLYVIMATSLHEKSIQRKALSTLSVASVVATCTIFGGGLSGCSMNPARSLGPAIVANYWSHHWIYWVGPPVGGVLAWAIYNLTHGKC